MRPTSRSSTARLTLAVCGIALALSLGACAKVRDQLGLTKTSPDEFSVLTRAPLSLPPDYQLRPPEPGVARPQEVSVQDRVKAVLYNSSPQGAGSDPTATVGESALLSLAGTGANQSNIRAIINRDNSIYAEEDGSFVESLIFWRDPLSGDIIVDAAAEDQRLQEAEATGESASAGETAIIERREQGILEGLF